MPKVISECPVCGTKLKISSLHCDGCGMELRNDFDLNPFDLLNQEQSLFLTTFLKHRGNMRSVQNELGISYPSAKKRLDDLLVALHLAQDNLNQFEKDKSEEGIDLSNWEIQKDSIQASDIIKRKLMENKGIVTVRTIENRSCNIKADKDGVSFFSGKRPIKPTYRYEVFDIIVDFLISQGGRARKGNGRSHRLGEPGCDETTVVGAIGYRYSHAKSGDSVYDPVFVLAAVLDWAGIARNERGALALTADYLAARNASTGDKS